MKINSCILVGLDAKLAAVARGAAQNLFPHVRTTALSTLEEALSEPESPDLEGLILMSAESQLVRALKAANHHGLPRWAIVAIGTFSTDGNGQCVLPEDWTLPNATRALRFAVHCHQLARENVQLRGDLLTLSRRISHDLRTPLGGIASACEVIKQVLADTNPSDAELLRPLLDSADDLSSLISRVSFLLKASANPISKQTVAMGEVIWAASQRLERHFLQRRLNLVQPGQWPEVEGVSSLLEEVWRNLLKNAQQHAAEGTTIELGWRQDETVFHFWVRNEGETVPGEKRSALFQPFHDLHQLNARKGLGLSIVQRLVELHGGSCHYEPVPSGGSVFSFSLPVASPKSELAPPPTALVGHGSASPCSA